MIKQYIVVNMAVDMPIGRLAAQIAHASWLAVLPLGKWDNRSSSVTFNCTDEPDLECWLRKSFTKVVLKEWGEDKLFALRDEAEKRNILCGLMMEDDGQVTALSIGPVEEGLVKDLVGELKLL